MIRGFELLYLGLDFAGLSLQFFYALLVTLFRLQDTALDGLALVLQLLVLFLNLGKTAGFLLQLIEFALELFEDGFRIVCLL